jgi:hypothetical protein
MVAFLFPAFCCGDFVSPYYPSELCSSNPFFGFRQYAFGVKR